MLHCNKFKEVFSRLGARWNENTVYINIEDYGISMKVKTLTSS